MLIVLLFFVWVLPFPCPSCFIYLLEEFMVSCWKDMY